MHSTPAEHLPQVRLSYDQAWATPNRAGLIGSKERFGTLRSLVAEAVRAT